MVITRDKTDFSLVRDELIKEWIPFELKFRNIGVYGTPTRPKRAPIDPESDDYDGLDMAGMLPS